MGDLGTTASSMKRSSNGQVIALRRKFRTGQAKIAALGLIGSVCLGCVSLCVFWSSPRAAIHASLWFAVLLTMGMYLLPAYLQYKSTLLRTLCFVGCALLLTLPRTESLRRVLPACGTISAASVLCVCRALTVLFASDDTMRTWSRWRMLYYFCAFGWHDFRTAFLLDASSTSKKKSKVVRALAISQIKSVSVVGLCIVVIIFVAGRPKLESYAALDVAKFVFVVYFRGVVCASAFYHAFVALDVSMRMAYVLALDGVGVEEAFGTVSLRKGKDPPSIFYRLTMNCSSVATFWGHFWNRPVNNLLVNGVYLPLIGMSLHKNVAVFAVFCVSGFGHLASCNAAGMPAWIQLCMLLFFLVQPCFIIVERHRPISKFVRGPLFVFLAISSSAPLFTEPLFHLFGWGIELGDRVPLFLKDLSAY